MKSRLALFVAFVVLASGLAIAPAAVNTSGASAAAHDPVSACAYYVGDSQVEVSWDPVAGVTHHIVKRSVDDGPWSWVAARGASVGEHLDDLPTTGEVTGYQVLTKTDGVNSTPVECERTYYLSDVIPACTYEVDASGVNVEWSPVSGIDSYVIERVVAGGDWEWTAAFANETKDSFVDDLPAASIDSYRIMTKTDGVFSTATTCKQFDPVAVPDCSYFVGDSEVAIYWTPVAGVDHHVVKRSIEGAPWQWVASRGGSASDHLDLMPDGQVGGYQLHTKSGGVNSESRSCTRLESLDNVVPECSYAVTSQGVEVSWTAVSGIDSYIVERSVDGSPWEWTAAFGDETRNSFIDELPTAPTTGYRIKTKTGGVTAPSKTCSTVGHPVDPQDGECTYSLGSSQIDVSWTPIVGSSGYVLNRSLDGSAPTYQVTTVSDGAAFVDSHDRPPLAPITGYQVISVDTAGNTTATMTCTEVVGANAVPDCSYTAQGNSWNIEWSAVEGIDTYRLEREINGLSWAQLSDEASTAVAYSDSSAAPGDITGYRISTQSGDVSSLATDCQLVDPTQADCVSIQQGIPVIEDGFTFFEPEFGYPDAIWPNELPISFGGSNILYGYMWVPDNWTVAPSGYYELVEDAPGSFFRAFQLDGNGYNGIEGFSEGTRKELDTNSVRFSPRGRFPQLDTAPGDWDASEDVSEFGGHFALIGLNLWGDDGTYAADVRFDIEPNPNTPDAPYVPQPCWEYGEVVPGYGPGLTGVWRALQIVDEATQDFLTYVHSFVGGCVAAVEEFFGSIVAAVQELERLFTEREAYIYEKISEIVALIEQAIADTSGTVKEVLSAILQLDLLREDPVRWVGTVGCSILIDVLVSAATGAAAAAVAAKLLQRVQSFLNNRRDRTTCTRLNSFPTGTPVLMADGSYTSIESISAGDEVLSFDTSSSTWETETVVEQWSHIDRGHMVSVILSDGSSVHSTDEHRFWTSNRGWVEAEDLLGGDLLVDPSGTASVSEVAHLPGSNSLVWELSVSGNRTFAVSTGTHDLAVHNEDSVQVDPTDPYTWPNNIDDRIDDNGSVVEGYRTIWQGLSPEQQNELQRDMYEALRDNPDFGADLPGPDEGIPWPTGDTDLQADVWNKMTLGQMRVAMMDGETSGQPSLMRQALDSFLRGSSPQVSKHEWIPVSRAVAAKAKGVTAEVIRSYVTPTAETTGVRVLFDENGIEIGREPFAHNGANGGVLHQPLYDFWDNPDNTAADAVRLTEDFLSNEFILNEAARTELDQVVPDLADVRGQCP